MSVMNLSDESTEISTLDGKIRELRATELKYYGRNGFVTSNILRMVFYENTYGECKKKICENTLYREKRRRRKNNIWEIPPKKYFINLVKSK
jgi:hypothetical protein